MSAGGAGYCCSHCDRLDIHRVLMVKYFENIRKSDSRDLNFSRWPERTRLLDEQMGGDLGLPAITDHSLCQGARYSKGD